MEGTSSLLEKTPVLDREYIEPNSLIKEIKIDNNLYAAQYRGDRESALFNSVLSSGLAFASSLMALPGPERFAPGRSR